MRKDANLTVRIPTGLRLALERAAQADMRTSGNMVVKVLTEFLIRGGWLTAEEAGLPTTQSEGLRDDEAARRTRGSSTPRRGEEHRLPGDEVEHDPHRGG